jgi:hypothetical protein
MIGQLAMKRAPMGLGCVGSRRSRVIGRMVLGTVSTALTLACLLTPAALATVAAPRVPAGTYALADVACPSAGSCIAVGIGLSSAGAEDGGVVVPITNGNPGAAILVPGTEQVIGLTGIACASAASCEAVGEGPQGGIVVPITDGTPGTPVPVSGTPSLSSIACASAASCVAVGGSTVVPIRNGMPGTVTRVSGFPNLTRVACGSATTCEAVGYTNSPSGVVIPITNGIPGTPIAASATAALNGIACPGATSCEAVGNNSANSGVVVPVTNGTPGTPITAAPRALLGVACPSATSCQAAGASAVVPITNHVPGAAVPVSGTATYLTQVACQSVTSCEAVGYGAPNGRQVGVVAAITAGATRATVAKVKVRRSATSVTLACSGARCVGTITETIKVRVGHTGHSRTVASAYYSVASGKRATVSLKLNATGRRALAKDRRLKVMLIVRLGTGKSAHTVATRSLTLT